MRHASVVFVVLAAASAPAAAQQLTRDDSALVGRILLAEDRRDTAGAALAEGARHPDARIQLLARRAAARIRDPRFTSRDSFPPAAAPPPAYSDPAWRLRFRALTAQRANCDALRAALADSAWPVRLRAADLAGPDCGRDSALVSVLRGWASNPPASARRHAGGVSWHAAAHGLVALARIAPADAHPLMAAAVTSPVPWLRIYAAHAAAALSDTATLRSLAADRDNNVKEAAIDGLAHVAGHSADDVYLTALGARGYQAVRAAARALHGSPRGAEAVAAATARLQQLAAQHSENSRDARMELVARLAEFAQPGDSAAMVRLASDFDCQLADSAAALATRLGRTTTAHCSPLPISLPRDAVALALGREVRLVVTLADSSGGGSFTVRLRGDVAPIMAARVLELARSGWYDGHAWQRVEADFVLQGGGPDANEYVGHPFFMRDELGTIAHPRGSVGMSTRGHDTGDGQWFVNLRDNPRLVRDYTVFAEVIEGIEVVDGVLEGDAIRSVTVLNGR